MAQFSSVKDSKRGHNFELNLVPFIDLMCVCITFLLITAVWTQISMVKLGTSIFGQANDETPPVLPPDYVPLRIDIKATGFVITLGQKVSNVPKTGETYNQKEFLTLLKQVKTELPQKMDAVISIDDALPYQLLVTSMDNVIEAGFKDVGIAMGEVR
jgi:biopolymer transport protein TolR